jgi:hypothetical protein
VLNSSWSAENSGFRKSKTPAQGRGFGYSVQIVQLAASNSSPTYSQLTRLSNQVSR